MSLSHEHLGERILHYNVQEFEILIQFPVIQTC